MESLKGVTALEIQAIDGFGSKTSSAIATTLDVMWPTIEAMLALDFNLVSDEDAMAEQGAAESQLMGKAIVFTGSMQTAKRKELEQGASDKGAQVQSSVTGKTQWLVIGQKAGSKLDKAKQLNESGKGSIEILQEHEYLERVAD